MTANVTPGRRTTSSDVAQRAGLSRTTVSQILNGNVAQFPQETRDRVAAAAEELNYRPSRAGRALVTGVSDTVVIAIPSVTFGPHLQDAVEQITNAAATLGLSVVVRFAGRDNSSAFTSVLDLRPMAVIDYGVFSSEQRRKLKAFGSRLIPEVADNGEEYVDEVDILVGRLQVRELVRRGKSRIVFADIEDARSNPYRAARLQGIQAECAEQGLPEPIVVSVRLEMSNASTAVGSALDLASDQPLGVCCYNDDVAIAVLAAARHLGRSVPDQIGVIGVDHTRIGQLVTPRLATIHVDFSQLSDLFMRELAAIRSRAPVHAGMANIDPPEFVWTVTGDSC